jgi:hypothetical protein
MGLAADILYLFQSHAEDLSAEQKKELIEKFKKRRDDLERALAAVKQGLDMLGAGEGKKRPKRKPAKKRAAKR